MRSSPFIDAPIILSIMNKSRLFSSCYINHQFISAAVERRVCVCVVEFYRRTYSDHIDANVLKAETFFRFRQLDLVYLHPMALPYLSTFDCHHCYRPLAPVSLVDDNCHVPAERVF